MQPAPTAHWPGEIRRLAVSPAGDAAARGRLWLLIHTALEMYLRRHASRYGWVDPEDVHDLAAQKSLELVEKLDSQSWNASESSPGEIKAFLSTIARNSLVDLLRQNSRSEHLVPDEEGGHAGLPDDREAARPDHDLERAQFTRALRRCVGRLKPGWRTIWFFRVFYDLPSKAIAGHPEVQLRPAHVDVILQRCRTQIRECMRQRDFEIRDLPPGSYAALWEACRAVSSTASTGSRHE